MQNSINIDDAMREQLETNDSLRIYLSEIGRYPLLTQEDEIELFSRINNGDSEAKDIFIKSNLRLVVNTAKSFIGRGMDFLDLIQEGNIGLMKAVEMFDITRGCKFSTYATYWIKQSITYALRVKGRDIRLSSTGHEALKKYKDIESQLEEKLHRMPSIEEIAKEMGISKKRAMEIYQSSLESISLYTPLNDESQYTIEDILYKNENYIEEQFINKEMIEKVRELLVEANLKSKQLEILVLRYGLEKTLREIAEIQGTIHQNVGNKITPAFNKLKKVKGIEKLKCYL